jgi:hypothetical protein
MNNGDVWREMMARADMFQPGISVDCVIFGFYEGALKVLLNKFNFFHKWMLPGGFVYRDEDVDASACRVLKIRTGLDDIYLQQFNVFGNMNRTNLAENEDVLFKQGFRNEKTRKNHWFIQRFVSIGYYALVEYSEVKRHTDFDETVQWFNINELPELYSDHNHIIKKAIGFIRNQIRITPVAYKLLPEKFTLSDLRNIYEAILGRELDRRNFQRKIFSLGFVTQLKEVQKKPGFKPTTLYSFDKEKCAEMFSNANSYDN